MSGSNEEAERGAACSGGKSRVRDRIFETACDLF